jgi:hypothetical protein
MTHTTPMKHPTFDTNLDPTGNPLTAAGLRSWSFQPFESKAPPSPNDFFAISTFTC